MNFIELTNNDGTRFLVDLSSNWVIRDMGNAPAFWVNNTECINLYPKETYEEIKEKLLPKAIPVQTGFIDNTRPVTVFESYWDGKKTIKKEYGKGKFHQFSWTMFGESPGVIEQYVTAIIEMEDGTITNYPIDLIRFEDNQND